MQTNIFLSGVLLMTFAMVVSKRITALINSFSLQSFFLFLFTLSLAISRHETGLYIVAGLLFLLKVILVPKFLRYVIKRIKVEENVGLFLNPLLSLISALGLIYLAYLFTKKIMPTDSIEGYSLIISLSVTLIGMFIMIFRMKALTQIIGLLVMENGLFLAAASLSGGMPFFVEIAIFFDVFVCVIILGVFVFKISTLFTHIDVNKLTELKG